MDEKTEQIMGQLLSVLLQSFMALLTISGKNAEEVDLLFEEELKKFEKRNPNNLPPPPR